MRLVSFFRGFFELSEPLQVSLWNLAGIDRVESPWGKVFVFENPTVFSEVLGALGDKRPQLVCTNGQLKLASLLLFDKLAESGTDIFYSGDFDPEGILIADRLKTRYREKLHLWRYGEDDYSAAISKKIIDDSRLKKLERLKDLELKKAFGMH